MYDAKGMPLRAWKRATVPGATRSDGYGDVRAYELRTADVTIKHRAADGTVNFERLVPGGRLPIVPGQRPTVVLAPGRGVVSMWLKRAHLDVGGESRDLVLDMRSGFEVLEVGVLRREADRSDASLGGAVRTYTFFGQETVFADENDVVVGDLSGLRPSSRLEGPEPTPVPLYGEPDPAHTP